MTKRRTGPKGAGRSAGTGRPAATEPEGPAEAVEGSLPDRESTERESTERETAERETAGDGEPESTSDEGSGGEPQEPPIALLVAQAFGEPKRGRKAEIGDPDAELAAGVDADPHIGPETGGEDPVVADVAIEELEEEPVAELGVDPATDDRYVDDSGLMEALRDLKVRRDRNRDLTIGIGCGIAGLVIGLIIGNTTAGSGGSAPATVSPAVAPSRGDLPAVTAGPTQDFSTTIAPTTPDSSAAGVVTFTVTGNASGGVLITYGTNSTGSQSTKLPFTGSVPLDSSGGVLYYDVYAQLHDSGSLTCSVSVNGKVIKSGTATTTSDICSAQIAQDPATGQWQSE